MISANILIIDDEPGIRISLKEILELKGYAAKAVSNGADALMQMETGSYDLALIDLGLPDIDGLELLKRIKDRYPGMEAIILTGNATIGSAIDATSLGAFSYIIKPYEIEQLLLQLRRAIEKKQAAAELEASQLQMFQSEKLASIGQLAAGVAHEINNPMGFIISNISTLAKYVNRLIEYIQMQEEWAHPSQQLQEKRKQFKLDYVIKDIPHLLSESLEGAERVKSIVQNLKAFSRKDEMEWKLADINECLDNTLNVLSNELKYKTSVVKLYGTLPRLHCNPGQLNQVFINLLMNAASAIESSGTITIKTWSDEYHINVSVTDTGCGIPEDIIGRIFEPFFTTKAVGQGTGLGLSISHNIIKIHGGIIQVESREGHGTTFTISLPNYNQPEAE